MSFAILVTLTGMFIVFAALIFLAFCIAAMGKILGGFKKKPTDNTKNDVASTQSKAVAPKTNAPAKLATEGEVPGEVLAAISAAVAVMMEGKPFAVRSVRRSKAARPAWAMAGIVENTRPF